MCRPGDREVPSTLLNGKTSLPRLFGGIVGQIADELTFDRCLAYLGDGASPRIVVEDLALAGEHADVAGLNHARRAGDGLLQSARAPPSTMATRPTYW